MRVLMVSEDVPHPQLGGLGRHVLALAWELHRLGHTVDLVGNGDHPIEHLLEQSGPGKFFAGIRGHQRLYKEKQLGVFLPWRPYWNSRPLRDAIVRYAPGYDIVHYHGHMPWVASSLPQDLRFIQTRHDQAGDCMLRTRFVDSAAASPTPCRELDANSCAGCATRRPGVLQRAVSAHAVRRMRAATAAAYARHPVLFVSDFLRRGFAHATDGQLRGDVVYNAVDTSALAAILDLPPLERRAPRSVFGAAALYPYKGFSELLRALQRAAIPPGLEVTIAGDGPELPRLREIAAGMPVQLLGWTPSREVLRHTLAADVVVVPSLWDEPCATTVLEALAFGRTVLALRRGGTPELGAAAGDTGGRLCLFDSLDELVDALCGDRIPPSRPAVAALAVFRGSIAAMADAVLDHYERIVACGAEQ